MIGGKVLDTDAVLDIATGDTAYGQALLAVSNLLGGTLAVPLVTLSAAWQAAPVPARPWLELLSGADAEPAVMIIPVDLPEARAAGLLAADAGRPAAPLGTVHATYVALRRGWPLVTKSDGVGVALALSSDVRTETLP